MSRNASKLFVLGVTAGLLGGTAITLVNEQTSFAQSSTAGAVRGVVKDKSTGEVVIGATVVAQGPALQGQQAEITDENGSYFIDSLPPGAYTLTVFYNDAQFDRPNVVISVGKEAVVNIKVNTAEASAGETITVESRAPIVDQGSTKTGTTITSEYTENIPVGRTFAGVLGAAAGSSGDQYGTSMSGSESVESTYIVEGLDTTDTAYGGVSSNLPNEFVQETEVITGGYNAEYGRSIGGIVNVVTKQGSNEFHGSAFAYFTPGQLVASSNPIVREGSSVDSKTDLDRAYDLGAELGGPIIKDKVWFHVGINPSQSKYTTDRIVQGQVDADGDGVADVDPDTGFTKLVDLGAEGHHAIPSKFTTIYYTAKLNGALGQNHQWQVSGWGNPENTQDLFVLQSAPSRQTYNQKIGAYDVSAKWTSKFADGKTQVDASGGFHRGVSDDLPITNIGGDKILQFWNFERSITDFSTFESGGAPTMCKEADMTTGFINCPVINYGIGGLGFYEDRTNDRYSGTASLQQRVKLAGYHTFKLGFDGEFNTYDSTRGFTGAEQLRQESNGRWRRRTYLAPDAGGDVPCGPDSNGDGTPDTLCKEVNAIQANTGSRSIAGYGQDSWQLRPNLTFNVGVRYEQQQGYTAKFLQGTTSPEGEKIGKVAYTINNMWAPRLGVIYDPTEEGRAKVFAHWGRFYESIPLDLNNRSFGGEILHSETASAGKCPDAQGLPISTDNVPTIDSCFKNDPDQMTHTDGGFLGGGVEFVGPGTKGQYLDEGVLGAEYEFMPDFKMGINYIHRSLPRVIEDMSADSANTYLIGNPGEDYTSAANDLTAQAMAQDTICAGDPTSSACSYASVLHARAFNLSRIKSFDKPVRNYDGIEITANQRFSKNALLMASYTYSRALGNYPGLFSTETGQLDPNITSLYDLQDLMANRYGGLGLDRPHNLKIDGFYQFDLKAAGLVVLGASFRAQSGIPQNTLGAHFLYGVDESYLLSRGTIARLPATWETDIKATYGRKVNKNLRVDVFMDVFNLFNNQAETDRDERYTEDAENPIVGGDPTDLQHGKAIDGGSGVQTGHTAIKWKNFGNVQAHQDPLSIRFGLRVTF